MSQQEQGKDLPLTRYAIEKASQQDRLRYGEVLTGKIAESGIQQKELAERANVTARTIRNIEQGKVAAQADKLIALFIALGVELDGDPDADVRTYTRMLAPVIRNISPEHRPAAVADAVDTLTGHLFKHPNTHLAPVAHIGGKDVSGSSENDIVIPDNVEEEWAGQYAAHEDTDEPEDHTP